MVLFLLLTDVFPNTPIEFEHFFVYSNRCFQLSDANTLFQVRQPLNIVLV